MDDTHKPVMADAAVELMGLRPGCCVVECCVGFGGHASRVLPRIAPDGFLLGTDLDTEALAQARIRLQPFGVRFELIHANYVEIPSLLAQRGISRVQAILMDLGASSFQFDQPGRGFSLWRDGPLDMRMDRTQPLTAGEIVNQWRSDALAELFRDYADERQAAQIAQAIVRQRRLAKIATTQQLAALVEQVKGRARGGIHAATKVFMALRMAVNRELENLSAFLAQAPDLLAPGGFIVVIAFHSKEDRIVKAALRGGRKSGVYSEISPRPLQPSPQEIAANPRSRSAKLRRAVRA